MIERSKIIITTIMKGLIAKCTFKALIVHTRNRHITLVIETFLNFFNTDC